MSLLPFSSLPPFEPRRFVPADLHLGEWTQIAPLFDQLEAQAGACQSAVDFEKWLLTWGELNAALDEESSKRYIAMTCHTDSPEAERAYLQFVEQIEPQLKPRQFKLAQIFVAHPLRTQLAPARYGVLDREMQVTVELFRPANVPLETEEAKLGQQYQKLSGSLTVQFRGEEKTLIQMGRYLEEPDRPLREQTWRLVADRRLQETEKFENIFDQQMNVREKIAANTGFANYRDYAFRNRRRFDYTPDDCGRFHDAVEHVVMPLVRQLHAERRRNLNVPALRPWDLAVDPLNRPPLRPFEQIDQLVGGCQRVFQRLDAGLAADFRTMQDKKLLDLDNRKGKAPGGYQSSLAEARLPFIFMNSVGLQRDVETLLHEAGHAFHTFATQRQPQYFYRTSVPLEFCEVASMSMELLGNEFLEEFYDTASANRARRVHLEGIIGLFPWIATVDAFQHWLYTHPGHSGAERTAAWVGLVQRFGGAVDWSGLEAARAHSWHRQLHIFLYPFYYIEYGIAQLGALQVWANSKRDKAGALRAYQAALTLGGSQPLPALFTTAGGRFDFSRETIAPLMELVGNELARM